jgi:arsenate reductase-like glutaredoxin family protein
MAVKVDWYYHRSGCTGCLKASKFLDANGIEPVEVVPASRKLGRSDAARLAGSVRQVVIAKGNSVVEFEIDGSAPAACVDAMLGPTGNLRAPAIRAGRRLLIGFDDASYRKALLR